MFRTALIGLAAAVSLAACSPKAEAPKAAETAPAAAASPAVEACTGARLPLTGLCADPLPQTFGQIRSDAPLLASTCVWKTVEVQRSDTEALVFRSQDCSAEGWGPVAYRFEGPQSLVIRYSPAETGGEAAESEVAHIIDLPAGKTAEAAALEMLSDAPENERARCLVRPLPDVKDVAGEAFELAPNAELEAELRKGADGPIGACGRYGFTEDAVVFWEKRPGHAVFHSIGQDDPYWDPASFTFYKREPGGAWAKQ